MEKDIKKLLAKIRDLSWKEIRYLGINMQVACKIKRGEAVTLRPSTVERLEKELR